MHRNIKLMALFNFFTDLDFLAPVAIIYFAKVSGSYALGMSVFSVVMVSQAFFEIPTGIYSDFIGRKRTLFYGSLAGIVSALFIALGHSYFALIISAIFAGLTRAFYSGNNDALVYETLQDLNIHNQYHEFSGKLSSLFQLGLAFSAVVGSLLAAWSFPVLVWVRLIPNIVRLIISIFIQNPHHHSNKSGNVYVHLLSSLKLMWQNGKLRLLSMQDVLSFGIGESAFQFTSAFINTVWPLWAIGISKALSYIGGFIGFWFSGQIISRLGGFKTLLLSNIYAFTINLISTVFPTPLSPVLMSTTSIIYGSATTATNSLMQHEFTDKERATLSSINSFFGSIFFAVFSVGLGFIADILNPTKALIFATICILPILYINSILFKSHKDK